jgi:hypothetical protein
MSDPAHALRLTFAYRAGQIRLLGSERIAMIVPAPATSVPEQGQVGYWFGVLDAAGRVLYHRPLHDPLRVDVEAFSPDPRASITRVPSPQADVEFTVLVPDTADAQSFTLQGPADPARIDRPATELLRLAMDALRKAPPPPRTGRKP